MSSLNERGGRGSLQVGQSRVEHVYEPHCEELGRAQYFADVFGPPPHSFSLAVRNLINDHHNNGGKIGENSIFQLTRLQKAPSFLAHLYYATRSYFPDRWEQDLIHKPVDLVMCYDARTLAVVVALSYLYKRAKRICHPNEWQYISNSIHRDADIAMQLGVTFPDITTSSALFAGAVIHIAQVALQAEDPQGFQRLRRMLKSERFYNPEIEFEIWGCKSHQIAACLMTTIGFRTDYSASFCRGFDSTDLNEVSLDQESARFRHIRAYLESVYSGQPLLIQNECESIEVELLLKAARELKSCYDENSQHWLVRNKDDISPSKLSELQGIRWDKTAVVLQKLGYQVQYEIEDE